MGLVTVDRVGWVLLYIRSHFLCGLLSIHLVCILSGVAPVLGQPAPLAAGCAAGRETKFEQLAEYVSSCSKDF